MSNSFSPAAKAEIKSKAPKAPMKRSTKWGFAIVLLLAVAVAAGYTLRTPWGERQVQAGLAKVMQTIGVTAINTRISGLEGKVETTTDATQALVGQQAALQADIKALQNEVADGNINRQQLAEKVSALSQQANTLAQQGALTNELQQQLANVATQVNAFEARLTALEGRTNAIGADVTTLQKQVATLIGEVKAMKGTVTQQGKVIGQHSNVLGDHDRTLTRLMNTSMNPSAAASSGATASGPMPQQANGGEFGIALNGISVPVQKVGESNGVIMAQLPARFQPAASCTAQPFSMLLNNPAAKVQLMGSFCPTQPLVEDGCTTGSCQVLQLPVDSAGKQHQLQLVVSNYNLG